MLSVEATKAPALTTPLLLIVTPLGLTRNTWPLAFSCPAMVEGVLPVTRLSIADVGPGCWMSTRPPAPIEKLCQLTMAVGLVCVIVIWPLAGAPMVATPCATAPPVGRVCAIAPLVSAALDSNSTRKEEEGLNRMSIILTAAATC
jgi:hypothetical protein